MQQTTTWLENQQLAAHTKLEQLSKEPSKFSLDVKISPTELPLSQSGPLAMPKGEKVDVFNLSEALKTHGKTLEQSVVPELRSQIEALTIAKANFGWLLRAPRNTESRAFLDLEAPKGESAFQRCFILAEEGSTLELVLGYESQATGFLGQTIDVIAQPNSIVKVTEIQDLHNSHLLYSSVRAKIDKDAKVFWKSALLGASRSLSQREFQLVGRGGEAHAADMVYADHDRQAQISTRLLHVAGDTNSSLRMKGVMRDNSRVYADGLARIEKNAARSNSYVSEHALLIDKGAKCDAIPSLEIENNDVKCAHSASVSQIDPQQLFYVQSRGVAREQAREEIAQGFLKSSLDAFEEGTRASIEARMRNKWQK
ncbi:MAG TPA: SufD family Fe-S cluster assembly protein [Candidatus Norongarragalinales archaeon]|jgi:Fe-S cluster assembly protein SufD|nr:SufD family Fe-S cluster assembly protein [Candidatus Norongarragalinales archaeon]